MNRTCFYVMYYLGLLSGAFLVCGNTVITTIYNNAFQNMKTAQILLVINLVMVLMFFFLSFVPLKYSVQIVTVVFTFSTACIVTGRFDDRILFYQIRALAPYVLSAVLYYVSILLLLLDQPINKNYSKPLFLQAKSRRMALFITFMLTNLVAQLKILKFFWNYFWQYLVYINHIDTLFGTFYQKTRKSCNTGQKIMFDFIVNCIYNVN